MAANGPLDRAEHWTRQAIAVEPRNAKFHHRLAEILIRQERLEEAIAATRLATEIAPNDPLYWDRLGWLYARTGQDGLACEAFRKCVERHPNPHSYGELGRALRRLGRTDEAREALAQAVGLAGASPMADQWRRELEELTASRTAAE